MRWPSTSSSRSRRLAAAQRRRSCSATWAATALPSRMSMPPSAAGARPAARRRQPRWRAACGGGHEQTHAARIRTGSTQGGSAGDATRDFGAVRITLGDIEAPCPTPGTRRRQRSRFWADPTSASRRCSTASWARSWRSSRPSPRPRATASSASGTATRGQIVFVDTPGVHGAKKGLNRFMVDEAMGAIHDVDAALLVMTSTSPCRSATARAGRPEADDPARAGRGEPPVVLAVNKVDR